MELVVRKYEKITDTINYLKKEENSVLGDIVVAYEVGFAYQANKRMFINSHFFCFHYCLDKYENKTNISFEILNSHEQTDDYCFWEYKSNFYNPNVKSKKFQIENSQIETKAVALPFEIKQFEDFNSIIEKIKTDIYCTHQKLLLEFNKNDISYDNEEIETFEKNLGTYVERSYGEIFTSELSPLIKEYAANSLSANLGVKTKKENKMKV